MSFTMDVRLELSKAAVEKRCCAVAELQGAVLASSGLSFKGPGRYGLTLQTESREILERYMAMIRKYFAVRADVSAKTTDRLGGQTHYVLSPEAGDAKALIEAISLLDDSQLFGMRSAPDAIGSDCCRRAFLRGAFLFCGSISDPNKSYQLEFAQSSAALGESICEIMRGYGLSARLSTRKSQNVCYVKDAEGVSDALALLGASIAVMTFENVRIIKGLRNDVNRQVNCDKNNMDKVLNASEKQLSMIKTIERRLGMDGMPDTLREIAQLRIEYPDASLTDLGQMLTPPIGKSGVNARMRKLEMLAESLLND